MKIAEKIPKDNYMLNIRAEEGKTDLFDVKPYLESEVSAQLKDTTECERIYNGKYFIEWDCGADLSADTILARRKTASTGDGEQSSPGDYADAALLN